MEVIMNKSYKGLLVVLFAASIFSLNAMEHSYYDVMSDYESGDETTENHRKLEKTWDDVRADEALAAVWGMTFDPSSRPKGSDLSVIYAQAKSQWLRVKKDSSQALGKVCSKHTKFMELTQKFFEYVTLNAEMLAKNPDLVKGPVKAWKNKIGGKKALDYYKKLYPKFVAKMNSLMIEKKQKSKKKKAKKNVFSQNLIQNDDDGYYSDGVLSGDEGYSTQGRFIIQPQSQYPTQSQYPKNYNNHNPFSCYNNQYDDGAIYSDEEGY
jgi:hypothetical protein